MCEIAKCTMKQNVHMFTLKGHDTERICACVAHALQALNVP